MTRSFSRFATASTITLLLAGLAAASTALSAQAQAPAAAAVSPPTAEQWRAFARQDVQAAYDVYRAEHPGMLDPTNPDFPQLLERARAAGLAAAENANSHGTYSTALALFSAELNDGHAQAFAKPLPGGQAPAAPAEWPRFLPVWRDGTLVVRDVAPDSPVTTGTRIISCNGVPIREFVTQRLRGQYIRAREEGQFWSRASRAFFSAPTSSTRARTCQVRTPDGAEREIELPWTPAPEDWSRRNQYAVSGDRRPIGLSEPRPRIFHIALPDFQPDEAGVAAYRALFEQIRARHSELSGARAVVLDLRHNNGGSSSWSRTLAERLWGADEVDAAMTSYFAGTEVWWRPTEGTIATIREYAEIGRRRGEVADAQEQEALVARLVAAQARGDNFLVRSASGLPLTARDRTPRGTSFTAPVYIVTPGNCASACLDALDVFTRFQGVKLIGSPTSGDSTYMEVRTPDLPSGRGRLVVPMKIWAHRPRGNGEIYQPHILMNGFVWSTEAFLDRIEQDLEADAGQRR